MKEPILAPILRYMRLIRAISVVKHVYHPRLLDIGCGWDAKFLRNVEPYVHEAVGIDFKAPDLNTDKIKAFKTTISNQLPFEDSSFNVVTMLAVLEHMSNPLDIAKEINRVLSGGGIVDSNRSQQTFQAGIGVFG